MADTAALSPQYLKQLRAEREARLAAKKGASAAAPAPPLAPPPQQRDDSVIEIESNSDSDEVQLIASPPKRKRADDGSDDDVQFLPSPPKRASTADDEVEVLDRPPPRSSTGGTFSCVICMDDVARSQRLKLRNCGHVFCGECVAGTLKVDVRVVASNGRVQKFSAHFRVRRTTCAELGAKASLLRNITAAAVVARARRDEVRR